MTDQFNIRLRDGLGHQVRVAAAARHVYPRDVIEDALIAAGFTRGARIAPGQLPLPAEDSPAEPADTAAGEDSTP